MAGKCKILCLIFVFLLSFSSFSQGQFKVLVFTKTNGWHHKSINEGVKAMEELVKKHSFDLEWQEDANYFNSEYLNSFDVVVFLNTSGDILDIEQQAALEEFIRSGKGFVGVHGASDTEHDWTWYKGLVGRMFQGHPPIQTAMVDVVDSNFPGMEVFPERYVWTDEWYEFFPEEYSKDLNILLNLDESTYEPTARQNGKEEAIKVEHPVSWYQYYDGGRSFYTAMGHIPSVYSDPWFLNHIYGGIYWAATGKGIEEKADK